MRLSKVLLCSVLSIGILAKVDASADELRDGALSRVSDGVKALLNKDVQTTFIGQFSPYDAVTPGYGPRPVDIKIVNDSASILRFLGYNIRNGKVVAGKEAPWVIKPGSIGEFTASGRQMAFFGPFGSAKYQVLTGDGSSSLGEIIFDWAYPFRASDGQAGEAIIAGKTGFDVAVSATEGTLTFRLTPKTE